MRDDGALAAGGALPTLIAWGDRHPAESMSASGVTLRSIALRGLPVDVVQALALPRACLGRDDLPAGLTASLETPRGCISLATSS